jgi:hypothetical protein
MALGEQHVPSGFGAPMHVHEDDDELFYILDGELVVVGPDGERKAGRGDCVKLPRRIRTDFRNAADDPARMLVALTHDVQPMKMFRHFDRAGRATRLTTGDIMGIAAQYGARTRESLRLPRQTAQLRRPALTAKNSVRTGRPAAGANLPFPDRGATSPSGPIPVI